MICCEGDEKNNCLKKLYFFVGKIQYSRIIAAEYIEPPRKRKSIRSFDGNFVRSSSHLFFYYYQKFCPRARKGVSRSNLIQ